MMSGRPVRDAAGAIGLLALLSGLAMLIAYCEAGCHEPARIPAYCTDEVAFTARLVACVESSPTRELSRECRKAVHERCGIQLTTTNGAIAP